MFVVDTNILIYSIDQRSPGHSKASGLIEEWRRGPERWFMTWPSLYEFLRVVTHPKVFERPRTFEQAWNVVDHLLASPRFEVLAETDRHPAVVNELGAEFPWLSGSVMHDFHIVALMREHGITEIRTADRGFERFGHLRVVNPLVG